MINTKQGVWLLAILGLIMVILLCILFFVPAKEKYPVAGIQITSPKANSEISSPLKITGIVNGGGWGGFEGQVGMVQLLDSTGKMIASSPLTATTDWMTFPVNFESNLSFVLTTTQNGTLIFHSENPSGLPQYDKQFVLPVKIAKNSEETITVKVYFGGNMLADSGCDVVFPADRIVPKTQAVAQVAIKELLNGLTVAEKEKGYVTAIPAGSKLNSISIANGVVTADFNAITESGGGSCSMASRVAQIKQTLLQFPTITSVKLSINGRTGDIFQP